MAMERTGDAGMEARIGEWRSYLLRRQTLEQGDIDELEDHLRSEMSELGAAGLNGEESFLIAIRRMGGVHELSREFARERSSRLWKQLMLGGEGARERMGAGYRGIATTVGIAAAAALAFKAPAAFGVNPFGTSGSEWDASFYARNAALLALPFLVGFFAWRRALPARTVVALLAPFAIAAVLVNAYRFDQGGDTEILAMIHLPILLWLVAGVGYLGGEWRKKTPRMDFVRFTGEWFIYYALIAFGGGVLCAVTIGIFHAIDLNAETAVTEWVLPCGAVGAVIVVAWLVEAKQSVIENMAPVLTAVFTPLFALMLVAAIVGMAVSGNLIDAGRDVLILLDVLLVVVLGLVLYAISARDPEARPGLMDGTQLVLVVSALIIDVLALAAIAWRISEFGWTPNRTAGLGLNVLLLANLAWTAWLLTGFWRGRRTFADLERWQTGYIPLYGAWAAAVVVIFPLAFTFR